MKIRKVLFLALAGLIAVLGIGVGSDLYAQGKGKGKSSSQGIPSSSSSGRAQDNSDSSGKSNPHGNSANSNGSAASKHENSDDRAMVAKKKASKISDNELNRYRGVSKKIGTTPEKMRAYYESALLTNPDLKYGNFVAANVIADNMHDRNPAITSDAILAGLAKGDSIGQTLQNLGLSKDDANIAKRKADGQIKAAKNRNK